jgi:hypothetical protein
MLNGRFEDVQRARDQNLDRLSRSFCAARDTQGRLVEDVINALNHTVHKSSVADIALDNLGLSSTNRGCKIAPTPSDKVVEYANLCRLRVQ